MGTLHQPITVVSARADGATSLALGLAAVLGARGRTVLVDLNMSSGEVATFLDLEEARTLYHLAYSAQLGPISDDELREHLQWHDGFAVLPGITRLQDRKQVSPHFLATLIQTLEDQFETVLIDGGRLHDSVPSEITQGTVLWVLAPRPLGMGAFDRTFRALDVQITPWLNQAKVVLNRMSAEAFLEVPAFVQAEYGLAVLGEISDGPRFWSRAELEHSLRALTGPTLDGQRFVRAYGEEAVRVRTDLEGLADRLASLPAVVPARN